MLSNVVKISFINIHSSNQSNCQTIMSRTRQGHVMYAHIRPFGWALWGGFKPPDLVRPGSMASDSLTRWSKELGWSENNTSLSVITVVLSRQVLNVQKQLAKEMLGEFLIMISSGVLLWTFCRDHLLILQSPSAVWFRCRWILFSSPISL